MSTDDLVEASPCKLRNGNWGCKTAVPVKVGDTVQITTRANKQWKAQVTQVVWTDDQVCICETASEGGAPAAAASKPAKTAGSQGASALAKPAAPSKSKASQPARPPAASSDNVDPRDGDPAFSNEAPPTADDQPGDDLDAMADRAADEQDDMDDWMSEMQAFERGS